MVYCVEVAGGSRHSAGETRQPGVGRPLGAGHRAQRDPGPAGGRPHRLQQEDGQCDPRGRLRTGTSPDLVLSPRYNI